MIRGIFAFTLPLLGILCASYTSAETVSGGFSVSPMFQEISLEQKDREKDFFITLTNQADVPVALSLSVLDFGSLDESGGVAFLGAQNDFEKKYSLASWMRPEKDRVTIGPKESQKIKVTIENGTALGPGGHYGAVTFRAGEGVDVANAGTRIAVQRMFSVLVFAKKIGGERYSLALKEKEMDGNFVMLPETARLRFLNEGNVHTVPRGTVTITDPLGRVVSKGIINEESGIILPETVRMYSVRIRALVPSLIPGYYTLDIAYRYDDREEFSLYSERFAFLPGAAIIGISLLLIAVTGWYAWRRRRNTGEYLASQTDIP